MRSLQERTPPAGQIWMGPQPVPQWFEDISAAFDACWVAVEGANYRDIVGMVFVQDVSSRKAEVEVPGILKSGRRLARLRRLVVAPERQRQGIGRQLTRTVIEWSRERGYDAVILETTPQQEAAVALYKSMGFREVGRSTFRLWELAWFELRL